MSSSFKENFGKNDDEQRELGYDDQAFFYFMLVLLSCSAVPGTYYAVIRPILYGEKEMEPSFMRSCQCETCKARMQKRRKVHAFTFLNRWFFLKIAMLTPMWWGAIACYQAVKDAEQLASFVPHEILGVNMAASVAEVKKAYRKLSKIKHPDKNPDNPQAKNEFIQINKAYAILTDEQTRENFLKYGNPEGRSGSFSVGIAMPKVLLEKDKQITTLISFFLLVTVIIPYYFWVKINQAAKDIGGVDLENRKIFEDMMDEHLQMKTIPGILGQGRELVGVKVRGHEELEVLKFAKKHAIVRESLPKKGYKDLQINVKPIILINSFCHSIKKVLALDQVEKYDEDLETILRHTPIYLDIMLKEAMILVKKRKRGWTTKQMTCKNILSLIQFSQNMMQGGFIHKNTFMQLPNMTPERAQKLTSLLPDQATLYTYCKMEEEKRQQIATQLFDGDEFLIRQQELCIASLPLVKLEFTSYVEGATNIAVGDILTCKLRVDFLGLKKGQQSGYVHSTHYPYLRRDNWYLIITNEQFTGIACLEKLDCEKDFYEKTFRERMTRVGPVKFVAILVNDCYRGLDQFKKSQIIVEEKAADSIEYKEEDIKTLAQISPIEEQDIHNVPSDSDTEAPFNKPGQSDAVEEDIEELVRRLKKEGLMEAYKDLVDDDEYEDASGEEDEDATESEGEEQEAEQAEANEGEESKSPEKKDTPNPAKKAKGPKATSEAQDQAKEVKKPQLKEWLRPQAPQRTVRDGWQQYRPNNVIIQGASQEEIQQIQKSHKTQDQFKKLFKREVPSQFTAKSAPGWACFEQAQP